MPMVTSLVLHANNNTKGKLEDERPVVTLTTDECRQCSFRTQWAEDAEEQANNADAQTEHSKNTGHRKFWHYTVQRGQSTLFFL